MAPWPLETADALFPSAERDAEVLKPGSFTLMSMYKILVLATGMVCLTSLLPRLDDQVQVKSARNLGWKFWAKCRCPHGTGEKGSHCRGQYGSPIHNCKKCDKFYELVKARYGQVHCKPVLCKYDEERKLTNGGDCKHVVCSSDRREELESSSPACKGLEKCYEQCRGHAGNLYAGKNMKKYHMMVPNGCRVTCDQFCPAIGTLQYHYNRDERWNYIRLRKPPTYWPADGVEVKVHDPTQRVCGHTRYSPDFPDKIFVENLDEKSAEHWMRFESAHGQARPGLRDRYSTRFDAETYYNSSRGCEAVIATGNLD